MTNSFDFHDTLPPQFVSDHLIPFPQQRTDSMAVQTPRQRDDPLILIFMADVFTNLEKNSNFQSTPLLSVSQTVTLPVPEVS